jgi:hypothetical protein
MKLSQAQKFVAIALVSSIITFIACGGSKGSSGGGTPTPTPTPSASKPRVDIGAVAGMHAFAANKTTSFNWSILPKAYAQVVTTISLSQSYNGICNLNPTGQAVPISFVAYGLGQYSSQNCTNFWSTNDTNGAGAAANAQTGQLVIGNGAVTNLVAWTSKGTSLTGSTSGQVHVYVRRATNTIDTGISCTLGSGLDYMKCASTQTFQVLDGDLLIGTLSTLPGDTVVGFNMVFTKA